MQKILGNATLALALLCGGSSASAIEAGGVRFDDKVTVGGSELLANGAGVRRRFVFDVYAIALYLPARASTAEAALAGTGARRIAMHLLRDVSSADFVEALRGSLRTNLGDAEFNALKPQIDQFEAALVALKEVAKGTAVQVDFLPGSGTRTTVGGEVRGKDIPGDAFYNALLKVWLGGKPVQADLKGRLLGH